DHPYELHNSVTAALRNWMTSPCTSASRSTPSAVERTRTSSLSAARTRRLANTISMVLASHTVQVTIEAKARPINTAFTTGSALRYMPHGLRSRGRVAVATTLSCASAGKGTTSHDSCLRTGECTTCGFAASHQECRDCPSARWI